jgi:hypothetical protein
LQRGSEYSIDLRLKEKYARSLPPMPFSLPVCWTGDRELSICLEPCERVVALFFVNSCGQPANPADVFVENRGQSLIISPEGVCTISGAESGIMRFLSSSFHLNPGEIHVDDRMAQAHVIQVAPKIAEGRKLPMPERDDFILEFEQLPRGNVSIEVLALSGKHLATLAPDPKGRFVYPAQPNDEFDFVLRVENKVVERVRLKSH